jgi:FkbM family methyltransferase
LSKLAPARVEIPFIDNSKLFMQKGMTGATGNYYCGLHEVDEMGFTLHFLREGDLFVDVGANIGSYTILSAGAVGARVIAVEPIPSTFRFLEENVLLNGLTDLVKCRRVGIADRVGTMKFSSESDTMNRILEEDEKDSIDVPVETIDSMLEGQCPKLMKIDVEGYEYQVLMGAIETLRNDKLEAIIMETNGLSQKHGHTPEDLRKLLSDFGFTACVYNAISREITPGIRGNNSIFVRDLQWTQTHLQNAKRFQLVNGVI